MKVYHDLDLSKSQLHLMAYIPGVSVTGVSMYWFCRSAKPNKDARPIWLNNTFNLMIKNNEKEQGVCWLFSEHVYFKNNGKRYEEDFRLEFVL